MLVEVSGLQFVFPPSCVCCGGQPDAGKTISATRTTGKRVVHVSTNAWTVPYCSRCLAHESMYLESQRRYDTAKGVLTGFVVAGVAIFLVLGSSIGPVGGVILGILFGLIGVFPFRKISAEARQQEQQARSACAPSCCNLAHAAAFYGWNGTLNSFEFVSQRYAGDFMIANREKLVNLNPAQVAWLNSSASVAPVGSRQRAQRYRS